MTPSDARFGLAGTGVYSLSTLREPRATASAEETSGAMGAAAARRALDAAGWQASDLDVVIGASAVMEQPIPGNAVLIQRRLGLGRSGIAAFDVNATCLSALVGLDTALLGFQAGRWRRALIVSAEIASAAVDRDDPETDGTFGDGAAALAIAADGPHRVLAHRFESYGDFADLCQLESGGTRLRPQDDLAAFLDGARFRMRGQALFRATARLFPGFLARLLDEAGMTATDIDLVIPHQASRRAIDHLARALPLPADHIIDIHDAFGNEIAASLPHALHVARTDGRLHPGMTVLLVGSSAGVSLGGTVVRW